MKKYDYIIIGSGFGGSVSALRLAEKGYRVLVIEKGQWKNVNDFPKTNWNVKKWLWLPGIGFKGILKMTFLRHLSVISGVGVGGGSLVYANTLPKPKSNFFHSGSWKGLCNWEKELAPHYQTAYKMLGAVNHHKLFDSDGFLNKLALKRNKENLFEPTKISVFIGDENKTVSDPFFKGEGPERTGCNYCGQCMTGCPNNSKNSLDKNYLFLAQKKGVEILSEHLVTGVIPQKDGTYIVAFRKTAKYFAEKQRVITKGIVFSGGVLGTVPLLLKLKQTTMPRISDRIGKDVRSNNESLIFVTSSNKELDFSKGVAIGSIFHTSKHSHLEPVRYGSGSGFWRLAILPMISEKKWGRRFFKLLLEYITKPIKYLKFSFISNFSKQTTVLLYMQDLEGKLSLKRSIFGVNTILQEGNPPKAYMPEAHSLARDYAKMVKGVCKTFFLESLFGIPSTAHILGGAVIGKDNSCGVINKNQALFGYKNIYVCDGSAISANPGVNPALTITAMTELAMSKIPYKKEK